MIHKLSVLPISIFLVILYFLFSGLSKDPTLIPSPLIGKPVPEFSSTTLFEKKTITNTDLLGETYILNVWGSWCYGCSIEHDFIMDINSKKTIKIYGLNYKDKRFAAISWLEKKGNPYQSIIFDDTGSIAIDFGVYGAPETFLINDEGIVIHKHIGPIDQAYYKKIILPVIEK